MMIGDLKKLGLALLAVLAVGAAVASAAPAQQGVIKADGPVTLTGIEQGGETENRLTVFGAFAQCPGSSYTGHAYNVTPHGLMKAEASTVTLTPKYKETKGAGEPNCRGPFGWTVTMDVNGCDYVGHVGEKTASPADTYGVTLDIVCPAGKEITTTIWTSGVSHGSAPFCIYHIPPQTGIKGADLTDTTNGTLHIKGTLEGIRVKKTEQVSDPSPVLCSSSETTTAKYDINVQVTGDDAAGKATTISLAEEAALPSGVLISDGPVTVVGTQTGGVGANALTAFGGASDCPEATFVGHEVDATPHEAITSGADAMTVTPSYGICDANGLPATIEMNGCDYVFDLESTTGEVDTYNVMTNIKCPPGSHVQWTAFSSESHTAEKRICTLTLTEQEAAYAGLQAVDTTNGEIDISGAIEGVTAHRTGGGILCPEGTTSSASLDVDVTMEGKDDQGNATTISLWDGVVTSVGPGALTSDGPVTLTATEAGEATDNRLTAFGAYFQCPGSTYTGHKHNETPHKFASASASTITLTPSYKEKTAGGSPNCSGSLGWSVTNDLNGCDFVLHIGESRVAPPGTYGVTMDIVCPVGKEITTTVWTTESDHTSKPSAPFCVFHIPAQTGLKGLEAVDTGNGSVDIKGKLEGIEVTKTAQAADSAPILCANATTTTGKADFDLVITGKNEAGAATSIALSHS